MIGVNGSVLELIKRRRLQLLIHSCIYYEFDESLVSDEQWKQWALELEALQNEFPDESRHTPFYEAFINFDHSTGYHLPTRDRWVLGTAQWLLRISNYYRS